MRTILIYNPTSGDEEHDGRSLSALLEAHGHDVRAASVKADSWEQLLSEPVELVVVAGGDGTIRKVFKELATSDVDVTVLPLGSANNIARTLGLTGKPLDRLIAGLPDGERFRYDVGVAAAAWGNAYVVESFGGGLFAEMLSRAEEVDGEDDKLDLGLRLMEEVLQSFPALEWELTVDGIERSGAFLAVEAMNIRETGPNVPLAPQADPGDGRLDVVEIRPEDRGPLLAYIGSRLRGERTQGPPLTVLRGRRLEARPPVNCPLRVDDQRLPAEAHARDSVVATTGTTAVTVVLPSRR
jgi:diacylglycerol kinase family enzyme